MTCPGSVNLAELAPPQKASKYANEGTKAHELAEKLLREYLSDTKVVDHGRDQTMVDYVKVYVNYVTSIKEKNPHAYLVVEEKFHNPAIDEDFFGTVDACIVDLIADEIHIFDLKYGEGITVEAEENSQLMYYALGATKNETFSKYHFHIVQPRSRDDEKIKTWSCDMERMERFKKDVRESIAKTREENAPLVTGDHCSKTFCPAITICPKYKEMTYQIACADFKDEITPSTLPKVETLTLEEMTKIVKLKPLLDNFCKQVEERIFTDLMNGKDVEGFKLVEKRKLRKWANENDVVSYLNVEGIDDIWEKKLKSPAQIEKVVGKKGFKDLEMLIDKSEGEPTLALDTDKRPAIKRTTAIQDFAQTTEQV
jgi:hypothetical protein